MACLFATVAISLLVVLVSRLLREAGAPMTRSPQDEPVCPACRYPLAGLPARSPCPECGNEARLSTTLPAYDPIAGRWITPWAICALALTTAPAFAVWFINDIRLLQWDSMLMMGVLAVHTVLVVLAMRLVAQRRPRATRPVPGESAAKARPERRVAIGSLTLIAGVQLALGVWSLRSELQRIPSPAMAAEHRVVVLTSPLVSAMLASAAFIVVGVVVGAAMNSYARRGSRPSHD
ncbi:MAG TPA: hypothetical protein VFF65_04575 [Phycisphaerales bacterium]|nr:hypothetical protein [Phycisphaerales bacterium]